MKFFRQTKETKRKLSFFLALAMVISLLPVSPVAKAAVSVKVINQVTNTTMTVTNTKSGNENVTGSAIIKLTADSGYKFDDKKSKITVSSESAIQSKTGEETVNVEPVTEGALDIQNVTYSTDKKTATINVNNVIEETTLRVTGEVFAENVECDVKITKDTLGKGITFSAKAGNTELKTDGTSQKVAKDTVITFTIRATDTNAIFLEQPKLQVGEKVLTWESDGNGYKATEKVTSNIVATISGGELLTVSENVTTDVSKDNAVADETTKQEISKASVTTSGNKNQVIQDVVKNITGSSIKTEDVNYVGGYNEEQVLKALQDGSAKITTALTVKKVDANKEKTEKNTVKGAKENDISFSDDEVSKKFGSNKAAQVSAVKALIDAGVVLDINLSSTIKNNTATMASIAMRKLDNAVEITMSIPTSLKTTKKGAYYVIRIHEGEITVIPCTTNDDTGEISFKSDKFSTYIVTFKEGDVAPTPTPGNNNGYIPGPGQSSSPSSAPSANPSGAPSANPSGAPSANPSSTPSANPSGAPTDPTNAPTEPTKAPVNPTKKPSTSVKVGKKATISGSQYKVTAVKGTRTVQFTKGKKNAKKIVIPSTVKVSGKSYKVTTIAKNALKGNKKLTKLTIGANINKIGANAFKGCSKLKSIIVKTKKLTKSKVGTNAFKGINAKATVKVPKAKVKAYKKIVKAKGAGKNVKVKK